MSGTTEEAVKSADGRRVEVTAHSGQMQFLRSEAKFKVLACGRRWGKTTACILRVCEELLQNSGEPRTVWWVAPVYKQSEIGLRKFLDIFPDAAVENVRRGTREVETIYGDRLEFLSADHPDHLRGEGVDLLVIDEAAEVSQYAWEYALSPTLADSAGAEMVAISTPKGRNWFFRFFQRGQDPDQPDYESWRAPSLSNPFIDHEYVEGQREVIPDRVYRQEYEAEFVDDTGGVFTGVRKRNVENYDWESFEGEPPYTIGVDFARHQDWTVIIALDADNKLVHFDRIQKVPWHTIQARVEQAYERYPGTTFVDASRDNKIVADLYDAGVEVEPVGFSNTKKREMFENLATMMEQGIVTIPDIPQLVNELELFEYDVTRAGNVRYHAPEGFHDDCVDALGLAAQESQQVSATWGTPSKQSEDFYEGRGSTW